MAAEPAVAADAGLHGFALLIGAVYLARLMAACPARLNSKLLAALAPSLSEPDD